MSTITDEAVDEVFVLVGAILVFFMQAGFAMIEIGSIQVLNLVEATENVLFENLFDAALCAICWWALSYGLAFGDASGNNGFVGSDHFGLQASEFGVGLGDSDSSSVAPGDGSYTQWLFGWAVASVSVTIVSGAVAERCTRLAYAVHTATFLALVYPFVACWAWNEHGWASAGRQDKEALFGCGATDFAGSGVVHATGGIAALIGAYFVGPREAFRTRGLQTPLYGPIFASVGTLTLWFGWLALNSFAALGVSDGRVRLVGRAACVTAISGAVGALVASVLGGWLEHREMKEENDAAAFRVSVKFGHKGLLAALAASSASCATCEPLGACFVAIGAACFSVLASRWLSMTAQVDDVVDAFAVHGVGGLWGLVAVGFVSTQANYQEAYPHASSARAAQCAGIFYGGDGSSLAANTIFALALIGWAGCWSSLAFGTLWHLLWLRQHDPPGVNIDDSTHNNHVLKELDVDSSYPGRKSNTTSGSSASADASSSSMRAFRVVSNQQQDSHHSASSLERPPAESTSNDASNHSIELTHRPGEEEKKSSPKGAPPAAKSVTWN